MESSAPASAIETLKTKDKKQNLNEIVEGKLDSMKKFINR